MDYYKLACLYKEAGEKLCKFIEAEFPNVEVKSMFEEGTLLDYFAVAKNWTVTRITFLEGGHEYYDPPGSYLFLEKLRGFCRENGLNIFQISNEYLEPRFQIYYHVDEGGDVPDGFCFCIQQGNTIYDYDYENDKIVKWEDPRWCVVDCTD
jgi:hypothetical protein